MRSTSRENLPRTSPEAQGVASAAVLKFIEALDGLHEVHSVMLLRHGSVVAEGWWSPYGPEHRHLMFSVSKSFTSTAVGLAVSEGHFAIDDPVLDFFPDYAPADANEHLNEHPGEHLAAMRVRHLLTMSTGHAADTFWPSMLDRADGDWIRAFFEAPVLHAPGTHFVYNTGATYLLSAIVQRTTGLKLLDYLQPRLFAPLGIERVTWQESPQGISTGGFGLGIRTEDLARFGQLYLQKGMWHGHQLVPRAWIDEATTLQIANGDDVDSDWAQGYGYQFWRCRHGAFRGDGAFGQYCVVMPEQDAVLAITGGLEDMQEPLNLVWDILLPAMSTEPLADDAGSQQRLAEKLASLELNPVAGGAESPFMPRVSGQTYAVEANQWQIETLTLEFAGSGCALRVQTAAGEETIPCGHGVWQTGQTALFNDFRFGGLQPTVSSGAWTGGDCYSLVVRLLETPFFYTLNFHFDGDELIIEAWVNVSFGDPRTLLTARRL